MGYPIHPLANVGLAGQYLAKLDSNDISKRYFSGQEKYQSTCWNRIKLFLSMSSTIQELHAFYPFQPMIKKTLEVYSQSINNAVFSGLTITALSWQYLLLTMHRFTIFNLGRRGKVLPFFKQYGKFLKTHRVFRQYLFTLFAPTLFTTALVKYRFLNHIEHLWATHARRMNQKQFIRQYILRLTEDPSDSQYPEELLPVSFIGSWMTEYVDPFDKKIKKENELITYLMAPNREEIQIQAVDLLSSKQDDGDDDDADDDEDGGDDDADDEDDE